MSPTVTHSRLALALFILRCFVGVAFMQLGSGKLIHPSESAAEFRIPVWLGLATMLTQFIGGILLFIGALTPLASLGIAGTMITATLFFDATRRAIHQSRRSQLGKLGFLFDSHHLPGSERRGPVSLDAWLFGGNENGLDAGRAAKRAAAGTTKVSDNFVGDPYDQNTPQ